MCICFLLLNFCFNVFNFLLFLTAILIFLVNFVAFNFIFKIRVMVYLQIQVVSNKTNKVVYDRCLADCEISAVSFADVVRTLLFLYKDSHVLFSVALPKNV